MTVFFATLYDFTCLCRFYRMLRRATMMLACFGLFSISGCSESELILPGERIAITQQIELLPVNKQLLTKVWALVL